METGQCKLCLQIKPLCKTSHIIPDFMYKGLYDVGHILYKVPTSDLSKEEKLPSGEYEPNLLCEDCENKIGKLESYACDILYSDEEVKRGRLYRENQKNQNNVGYTFCKGVDYKKFKLFLLSILWKSSISSRDFFKDVKLGVYEEAIREMILNEDPKDPKDYPCVISTYLNHKNKYPSDLIGQPLRIKDNLGTRYSFLIGGVHYFYFVSKLTQLSWISEAILNEENKMRIIHMTEEQAKMLINKSIGDEIFK
ncbi:MAG: hypothetical protein PHZ04_00670 [Patescibacteria group bacterium]|nr:hypothetical protein [Patescibacteria group bacterium]MDD5554724.1 hypothetical protein [Patescibacteria group bacterium]